MINRNKILNEIEKNKLRIELNKLKNCNCPGKKSILEKFKKIKNNLKKNER